MIPVKLTLEGLYSYQTRQVIDFETLTQAGLFGIFGAVGSGKSSILEAITFALYGETERLNARDKRSYNMMNLRSNRSYIEFDFTNHEGKLFRITREFKRNAKHFEDVKPSSTVLYQYDDTKWIPLEHTRVEEILGLSYDNFKRTIIIPQGQFKEFLELGSAERTKMLKEIFSLQRYDLHDKAAMLARANQSLLDQLEGQLKGFESISEDVIRAQQTFLQQETELLDSAEAEYQIANQEYQLLKALQNEYLLLKRKKADFEMLEAAKPAQDVLRQQVEEYAYFEQTFRHLLQNQHSNQAARDVKEKELFSIQQDLQHTNKQIQQAEHVLAQLKPDFERLPQRRLEVLDMQKIVQIFDFSVELNNLSGRADKGRQEVDNIKVKVYQITDKIADIEESIQRLKTEKPSASELMALGQWYNKQDNLQDRKHVLHKNLTTVDQHIQQILEEFKNESCTPGNFELYFDRALAALEVQLQQLNIERNDLQVQQQIAHFAHALHEGSPCPLCGAIEHPHVVQLDDNTTALQEIQQSILQHEQLNKLLQQRRNKADRLMNNLQVEERQQAELQAALHEIDLELDQHRKGFIWPDMDTTDQSTFFAKKKLLSSIEEQLHLQETELIQQRAALKTTQEKLEKYQTALTAIELEMERKRTQIEQNKANLHILDWSSYADRTSSSVQNSVLDLEKENQRIESAYNSSSTTLNQLRPKAAAYEADESGITKRIQELQKEQQTLEYEIHKLLKDNKIENLDKVKHILSQQIDVVATRRKLEDFRIQFETERAAISVLETKLREANFSQIRFQEQEILFSEVAQRLRNSTQLVATISGELARLEVEFKKKSELSTQFEQLKLRGEQIKTMLNLFKGAGFVQYVSAVFLRQLCDQANIRFHRMTRNQLSLQLNENNDFEIIDYLNEGRSRSVKTLSGGQAFQVSLCLALALAESVQSAAKADRNFFFIDEGFGTQDQEAVNIVFETLTNLRQENRIVGIISHVEELKDRIPVSLSVIKDEQTGSRIAFNDDY